MCTAFPSAKASVKVPRRIAILRFSPITVAVALPTHRIENDAVEDLFRAEAAKMKKWPTCHLTIALVPRLCLQRDVTNGALSTGASLTICALTDLTIARAAA